jgi:hypothetical protein
MASELIQQVPNLEQDSLKGEVEKLRRVLPLLIENNKLVAKMRRAAYEAYIAEGFTEAQALQLCKG